MIRSTDIIGQDKIIKYIQSVIKNKNVSHSYIIEGETGSGKTLIAKYFSYLLNCENLNMHGKLEACGACQSCLRLDSDNNVDIKIIESGINNIISVDDIRSQIVEDVLVKPYSFKHKIYILRNAEKMTITAQNALLKTIEEPPGYAVIFLLTTSSEKLLPTINSRCVNLSVSPVKEIDIISYLENEKDVELEKIKNYILFCDGNIGEVKKLYQDDEKIRLIEEVANFLTDIDDTKIYDIEKAKSFFAKWKNEIQTCLDYMMIWYRDILVLKIIYDSEQCFYKKTISILKNKAEKYSFNKIGSIILEIEKTKNRIKNNVNYDLATEVLFLKLRRY